MKSGFIAMVGRPNVGKSTLTNKLVKEKVAIVSNKAGTTRDQIKGIFTKGDSQYIFVDTPGIHKPKHLLGEHMTDVAIRTLKEVEVILFILDGTQEISTGDMFVMEKILEAKGTPRIAVINKIDLLSDDEIENKKKEIKEKLGEFDRIITLSAEYGIGTEKVLKVLENYLVEGVMYYPEDMYTDMPIYKIISEIVREKILIKTKDEIPHSVAIEIINVTRRNKGKDKYEINIYVERNSQKGIIIGKNGKLLKEIGTEARKDIEELLGKEIYLNLWVKVKEKWRKKKPFLKELGYFINEE
ncbi:GTP-binding protein Era [Hypnocyclicus thermotrophus]|uniref:GTPase Era n=1 Tax=Hypnocyclicus thermotrophus TaxID=1627895 RepID=A0AA46I5X7_9FUSO|nr:GTPase Era [Hypnocyclicus thermotrophus]TDT71743.1 GTP-binding protein Era [Hypnocyclicus thermotrophus]